MTNRWKFVCAIIGLLAVAGCRSHRGPYSPIVREDGKAAHQHENGISIMDRSVRDSLVYRGCSAKRLPSGQIQVQVQMQNLYPKDTLWSDFRIVFYREVEQADTESTAKMEVDATEWQAMAFPPREVVLVQGTSLRKDATSYCVQFKGLRSRNGSVKPSAEHWKILEHGLWHEGALPE